MLLLLLLLLLLFFSYTIALKAQLTNLVGRHSFGRKTRRRFSISAHLLGNGAVEWTDHGSGVIAIGWRPPRRARSIAQRRTGSRWWNRLVLVVGLEGFVGRIANGLLVFAVGPAVLVLHLSPGVVGEGECGEEVSFGVDEVTGSVGELRRDTVGEIVVHRVGRVDDGLGIDGARVAIVLDPHGPAEHTEALDACVLGEIGRQEIVCFEQVVPHPVVDVDGRHANAALEGKLQVAEMQQGMDEEADDGEDEVHQVEEDAGENVLDDSDAAFETVAGQQGAFDSDVPHVAPHVRLDFADVDETVVDAERGVLESVAQMGQILDHAFDQLDAPLDTPDDDTELVERPEIDVAGAEETRQDVDGVLDIVEPFEGRIVGFCFGIGTDVLERGKQVVDRVLELGQLAEIDAGVEEIGNDLQGVGDGIEEFPHFRRCSGVHLFEIAELIAQTVDAVFDVVDEREVDRLTKDRGEQVDGIGDVVQPSPPTIRIGTFWALELVGCLLDVFCPINCFVKFRPVIVDHIGYDVVEEIPDASDEVRAVEPFAVPWSHHRFVDEIGGNQDEKGPDEHTIPGTHFFLKTALCSFLISTVLVFHRKKTRTKKPKQNKNKTRTKQKKKLS